MLKIIVSENGFVNANLQKCWHRMVLFSHCHAKSAAAEKNLCGGAFIHYSVMQQLLPSS